MPELLIRSYRPDDVEQVMALVRELQDFEGQLHDRMRPAVEIGPWYVERQLAECEKHAGVIVVAEQAGKLLGYATIFTDRRTQDEPDEIDYRFAHIGDLVVMASVRGQGVGRALLAACKARAIAAGVMWLRIGVLAGNQRAERIYQDFGFRDFHRTLEMRLPPAHELNDV